jgi:uncharacterized membrane protein YbhN (UPF0104 family)
MQQSFTNAWKRFSQLMRKKSVWRGFYFLVIAVSLAFIAYALYKNWNELKAQKWTINYYYIVLAVALFPIGMLPTVAAWHKLLEALGVKKKFSKNLYIYAISSLPRHIPGLVWYVSSRTLMYQEEGVTAGIVLVATALEVALLAITGFVTSTLLMLSGSAVLEQFSFLNYIIPVALILGLGLVLSMPVINKLLPRLFKRWKVEQVPRIHYGNLIVSMIWMFVAWFGGGMLLFLLVRGFTPLAWYYYPVMVGAWGMASGIGLTIGIGISGMGLREVTLGALLSLVVSPLTAVVGAVGFRLVITLGEFIWVFLFALLTKSVPLISAGRKKNQ